MSTDVYRRVLFFSKNPVSLPKIQSARLALFHFFYEIAAAISTIEAPSKHGEEKAYKGRESQSPYTESA
eukprot:scaffold218963_cov43-Attheya_sp.AAC.1